MSCPGGFRKKQFPNSEKVKRCLSQDSCPCVGIRHGNHRMSTQKAARRRPEMSCWDINIQRLTDQWAAATRITTKIPPLVNGLPSWFKYEVQIDDWLALAVLEVSERGPALKNKLVGVAEMYTGLLDREPPTAHDGVKFFKGTLRPHYVKGAQSIFLWRFYRFLRARRGNTQMVKWIVRFTHLLMRLKNAWIDMLLVSAMSQEQADTQYRADVYRENVERQR